MSFTEALPPKRPETSTGISCSLREIKGGCTFRLFINEAKQRGLFGKSLGGVKCKVLIGRDNDEGKLKIVLSDGGMLQFNASVKGSASLAVRAWDLLPGTARPGKQVAVFESDSQSVTLILPPWARPNGAGGKVEEERRGAKPSAMKDGPTLSPATKAGRLQQQARALEKANKG